MPDRTSRPKMLWAGLSSSGIQARILEVTREQFSRNGYRVFGVDSVLGPGLGATALVRKSSPFKDRCTPLIVQYILYI